jgi:type II secretion system protein N
MKNPFTKKMAAYTGLGIVLAIVFLYLRFPGSVVGDYITQAFSAQHPGAIVVIGAVKPHFPPGMRMENILYGVKRNPDATIQILDLTARPGWLDLFKGKTALLLSGSAYGGELAGRIDYADFLSLARPVHYTFKVSGAGLDRFAYIKGTFNRSMTGKLNGNFVFRRSYERIGESSGTGEFTIANGSYQLMENLLGFDSIEFSKIEGRLSLKGDALKLDRFRLTGAKFNCSLQGDIVLHEDMELSPITLTGAFEIAGMGGRKTNVAIGGILGNPTVRLLP